MSQPVVAAPEVGHFQEVLVPGIGGTRDTRPLAGGQGSMVKGAVKPRPS